MKILHLFLICRWYDMIESGVKTEEYREFTPYWSNRLIAMNGINYWKEAFANNSVNRLAEILPDGLPRIFGWNGIIHYDAVCFHRGYTNRTITLEYSGLTTGKGNPEWGAPDKITFIIKLGKRITMIEEQYISFETAKFAKKKGFNIPVYTHYTKSGTVWKCEGKENFNDSADIFSRPTHQLLARWLREERHICVEVYCTSYGFIWYICKTDGTDTKSSEYSGPNDGGAWDSYEDAMENGLQEALKML